MSRRSIHNSTSSIKQRQLSHLNAQLAQLQANLTDLDNLIKITAIQAEYIEKIGLMHGSLFMASHDVFERESFAAASFAETVQDQNEEQDLDSKDGWDIRHMTKET